MDKINDVAAGMFAGTISSTLVVGIGIPIFVALVTMVLGHFLRRYLHRYWPIHNRNV